MRNIFISAPTGSGHTWTITSKLGHILSTAQEKYGARDISYTILGIEFTTDNHPRIWYPANCRNVVIQITLDCINDLNRAVYQVAHEAIHCLCPAGGNNANVLEEGLATLFSFQYCLENSHGKWQPGVGSYEEPMKLVQELLNYDPEIIRKLRLVQPSISSINKDLILEINPEVPQELAEKLTLKFYR